MQHDFSTVFDTDNELWQRVLDIFAKNEKYEKKVVSNRNLHHKFPRSFSKMLNEPVDNDKDNLISLSLSDHFLIHYYYYLLARKGFRQRMATAFTFMAKKGLKFMTPDTAEAMAKDYDEARTIANQHIGDAHRGTTLTDEHKQKISENNPWKGKHLSTETRQKLSEAIKGHTVSDETREKIATSEKGKIISEETRRKLSEVMKGKNLGKTLSDEARKKMSESKKGKHWKLVDGKRVYY